ncbi:MAG: VWA domain-containing protein [Dehalococcoidia bacterium]
MTVAFGFAGVTFARPWLLLLLLVVPVIAALLLWLTAWRRASVRRLVGHNGPARASGVARALKAGLLLTGLSLLVLAAARPQIGSRSVLLPREGADVMVALDVSASMLATDIEPNRFEHAKVLVNQLIDGLQGDRVGLVVFAGNAIVRFPLTTDVEAARALVGTTAIREGNLRPGTGMADALNVAAESFSEEESARSTVIVLIGDGEDLGDGAVEAVRAVRDRNIHLYTVGLGTEEGSPLTTTDQRTGQVRPRIDPESGQQAVSRANETLMRAIASAGGGRFVNGNGTDVMSQITQEIVALERTRFESQEGSVPVERFPWFLAAGLGLILIETLIPERRRRSVTSFRQERSKAA